VLPAVINSSLMTSADHVHTVSCVAHFAFPPVELVWLKGETLSVNQSIIQSSEQPADWPTDSPLTAPPIWWSVQ